jgi:hypothetical protein
VIFYIEQKKFGIIAIKLLKEAIKLNKNIIKNVAKNKLHFDIHKIEIQNILT